MLIMYIKKKINHFTLYRFLPFLFCLAFFVTSCSKAELDEPIPDVSNDFNLKSFSFSTENPGITSWISGNISSDWAPDRKQVRPLILVTVPEGCNLASLIPTFSIHEKAKLYINDVEQKSGKTTCNFSDIAVIKVVAESGISTFYDIIVKNGDTYIDDMVYTLMKTFSLPGVSLSVSNGQRIIYNSAYGFADVEGRVKTTPKHLFRLASLSKQFTAVCVMKLYEEGKIDLDRNVFGTGGYLNDEYPGITGVKATVTLRHFLQHNSGWRSDPLDPLLDNPIRLLPLDGQIKYMLNDCVQFNTPGTNYSYYNLGFAIAGLIIEKVSGKKFETYLKEVLALADITDIHVGKDRAGKRSNECIVYSQNGTNGYTYNMDVIAAAGGIIASTEELMKFIVRIDGKGTDDILKKETINMMYTRSPTYNYALGWRIGHRLFPGAHYHDGNLYGTSAIWCGDTDAGISAALLMNSRSYISTSEGSFSDSYYILLGKIVAYFTGK